jgi:hypothetical protein
MKHCTSNTRLFSIMILVALFCSNCHNYYKALTVTPATDSQAMRKIDSLQLNNRYFVLRNGSEAYNMRQLQISPDHTVLSCTLDTLPAEHKLHLVNGRNRNRRYKKYDRVDLQVLSEVHLYIQPDNKASLGPYSLALNQVNKIEVIQKDKKRSTNSYVLGALGYTIGISALITAVVLATKSSCPFVSAYDGNQFSLQGEIYGGAIYPQLARHDYLPLKMGPAPNGTLQLKISNELQERQFTDLADLLVVTHRRHTRILADETGNLYSIEKPELPFMASLNNKPVNTKPLQQHNDQVLQYFDDTSFTNGHNEMLLQFNKAAGAARAKLVLSLKNSYWLDYLYGELAKGFGRFYPIYIKQQNKKSPAALLQWVKDQQIPLEVSVKTDTGWKTISSLTTIGPVATREIVVPLPDIRSQEKTLAIRLSSGFMFWEIDYAAIDYSPQASFTVQEYTPISARDELNKDVLPLLQKEDGIYCEQPVPGNIATLSYQYTPAPDTNSTQTFILHTKGYYTHVRHFRGGINKPFLQRFKQPAAFTSFSMQRYKQLNSLQLEALSHK